MLSRLPVAAVCGLIFFQVFVILIGGDGVGALKFILEPDDTVVPRGASVVLNCAVRGDGLPKISWKKDGVLLSFTGDTRRSILANGSLLITSIVRTRETRPEEGNYQCVATLDGAGSIISRFAKVQAASLSRFDEQPEDMSIGIGQTARFGCSANGVPAPNISWFKDKQPLVVDPTRMIVLPSGSLEITKVRELDQGIYKCHVSNIDKQHISGNGRLVLNSHQGDVVDTPPVFTAVPKSRTVVASNSVVLECSAVSYPQPKISWLKDGVTIDVESPASRFSILGEGNLQILQIEDSDRGTYQCRAENREDSADVSATIDIHVPPKAVSSSPNFYAYEKEDVELPCNITGRPLPLVQWFKNGERIMEGDYFQIIHGNSLKILGLVSTDAGMYQCFGTNPAGSVQMSIHLRVLKPGDVKPEIQVMDMVTEQSTGQIAPTSSTTDIDHHSPSGGPSTPREISAVLVSTRFVTLTWKAPVLANGNIIAYAIYYKEIGSDRERVLNTTKGRLEEINVQGLQPNKKYTFRVVPYNEKGPGLSSPEITVTTQPEVNVPGPPTSLFPVSITPSSIKVAWNPPEIRNGEIQRYKVFYVEASSKTSAGGGVKLIEDEEETEEFEDADIEDYLLPNNGGTQTLTVNIAEAFIDDLKIFTEYFVWVVAVNQNGPGSSSEEIKIATLSDVPADTPHNVSAESASSTSIIVRWEPPPLEFRNGIITGYKIKYKQKGKKKAETLTTDGNTHFLVLSELEKATEYQIKLAALNVNGSGPNTDWIQAITFHRDLDETQVPVKPGSLHAQASADSISITWTPPRNQNIMVRGYTIGWGRGIPDVDTKLVDGKRRAYTIDELQPNSDYVISVRAYNQVGDGEPVYEYVRTRASSEEDFDGGMIQLPPPIGLRAIILSATSAVLYWTDSSLSKTQIANDNRLYAVRYLPTDHSAANARKSPTKYVNTTQMNIILDDLRPGTQYEFSVKVVKNRLSSEWSLVAINTTFSLALLAPPQDLTLLSLTSSDGSSSVVLNWQPPKVTGEDEVKGYVVFYTTKPSLKEWVEESIPDDVLTHRVQGLTADTNYYFRMAANYPKGLGLYTEIKSAATPPAKSVFGSGSGSRNPFYDNEVLRPQNIVFYILIGLSAVLAIAIILLCIYYRKKGVVPSPNKNSLKKNRKPELKPPDLWIHHDQMELKNVEKGSRRQTDSLISPSSRGSREYTDLDEKVPLQCNTNSLDKKNFLSSYLVSSAGDGRNTLTGRSHKSQLMSDSSGHNSDGPKTYETSAASGSSAASSQNNLHTMAQYSATSEYGTQSGGSTLGTLNRRTMSGGAGNLKSFAVPTPPTATGYHHPSVNNPPNKMMNVRPMGGGVVGIHPSTDLSQRSPVKRVSTSQLPMVVGFSKSISPKVGGGSSSGEVSPVQKCYSTEELSQEISNLEGLMKDLNAITASEFQC